MAAVGFYLLAGKMTVLDLDKQWMYIVLAGAGVGFLLGPASTDAVNRAPRSSYSQVTGITQTSRNFGASLGLAVLGALLISENRTNVADGLVGAGVPRAAAQQAAQELGSGGSRSGDAASQATSAQLDAVHMAFAQSTQTIFYVMAGVMAVTFLIALIWLPGGRVAAPDEAPGEDPAAAQAAT